MIPLGSLAPCGSGAAILNINPTISPPLWQVLAFPARPLTSLRIKSARRPLTGTMEPPILLPTLIKMPVY